MRAKDEILEVQRLGMAHENSASGCAYFGEKHIKREGLGEIVVGSGIEAVDDVAHGVARGDNDGLCVEVVFAEFPDNGAAVHARKHDIDNHDVVSSRLAEAQTLFAVIRECDFVTFAFERATKVHSEAALVFDDQYLHVMNLKEILIGQCKFSMNPAFGSSVP